ncbi:MAG: GNAT family N-acetyltransferase [Acidobacteriota bacterium]|nr:GNAT family N-acetyltransferase [Acidobacteriota bacterium]
MVRKATTEDMPYITRIAWRLALDYPGLENDIFYVAEERGKIIGILGLKDFGDFLEMRAVGVLEDYRQMGSGRKLVEEVLASLKGRPLYLLTTIPGFYEPLGFKKVDDIPLALKKDADWCAGCEQQKCTAMFHPA